MSRASLWAKVFLVGWVVLGMLLAGCGGGGGGGENSTPNPNAGQEPSPAGANQALLGPLAGAEILAFRLTDLNTPIEGPITANDDMTDLTVAGTFDLWLAGIPDDEWILVTATGGSDIDADDDGAIDSVPTANWGTVHAVAKAGDWRQGGKINVLTDLAWRSVVEKVQAGQFANLEEDLKWAANNLFASDITGDGVINYRDLVRFTPWNDEHKSRLAFDYETLLATDENAHSLIGYIHAGNEAGLRARIAELFETRLVTPVVLPLRNVQVTIDLPANREGLTGSDLNVSSFVSDTARIVDSDIPTLLMAEDSEGRTVMLGYASGVDAAGFELSAESTALSLVLMTFGGVEAEHRSELSDVARHHADFPALVAAIAAAMAADPYFLDSLMNYGSLVKGIRNLSQAVLNEYTAQFDEQEEPAQMSFRAFSTGISPGNSKNFSWPSPWRHDQPWYWYGSASRLNVLASPFLAGARDNPRKFALANPTNVNYAAEFYDRDGNLLSWRMANRNSTMIQKAINSGAARTDIERGRYLDTDVAHIELNKYWFVSDHNERRYATLALHVLHLTTGVLNVVSDATSLRSVIDTAVDNKGAIKSLGDCGQSLASTVDYGSDTVLKFLQANGWSLVETTITGCALPLVEAISGNALKKAINSMFATALPKVAAKFSNPAGWAVIIFDIGNDLAPFGTSLLFAEPRVGYRLEWSGNQLAFVTRNDARPTGGSPASEVVRPYAHFDVTPVNGLTYRFDSGISSFDASANPGYEWGIDGSLYSSAVVDHTFSSTGEKNVRLTIYDGLGNSDEITRKVFITNGQPPIINSIGCAQSSVDAAGAFVAVKVIAQDHPLARIDWYLDSTSQNPQVTWTSSGGFTPEHEYRWVMDSGETGMLYNTPLVYPNSSFNFYAPRTVIRDSVGNEVEVGCITSVDRNVEDVGGGENFTPYPIVKSYLTSDYWNLTKVDEIVWADEDYQYSTLWKVTSYPVDNGTINAGIGFFNHNYLRDGYFKVVAGELVWHRDDDAYSVTILPQNIVVGEDYPSMVYYKYAGNWVEVHMIVRVEDHLSDFSKSAHSGKYQVAATDVLRLFVYTTSFSNYNRSGWIWVERGVGPIAADTNSVVVLRKGVRVFQ